MFVFHCLRGECVFVCVRVNHFIRFPDRDIESEYYCKCNGARWRFTYWSNTSGEMRYNEKNTHVCIGICICICISFVCTASANQMLFLIFGMISKMCIIKNDYLYQSKCDQLHVFRFVVVFLTELRKYVRLLVFIEINKILKEFLSFYFSPSLSTIVGTLPL